MSRQILLVEDSFPLRLALSAALRAEGYAVAAAGSAEEAEHAAAQAAPDLVLLDWNLPGASGLSLLRSWRAGGHRWPVILLTARDAVADRVRGLDAGADDYLVKPFANAELLARIRVQLRDVAAAAPASRTLRLGACEVDLDRQEALRGGERIKLTTREAELLAFLSERPGRSVSREDLLREVWGYRGGLRTRTIDNTMARLRAKVEVDPAQPRHLITVHGMGYRFAP